MTAFYEYTTVRLLVVLINTRAHQCLACGNSDCAHKSINSPEPLLRFCLVLVLIPLVLIPLLRI